MNQPHNRRGGPPQFDSVSQSFPEYIMRGVLTLFEQQDHDVVLDACQMDPIVMVDAGKSHGEFPIG